MNQALTLSRAQLPQALGSFDALVAFANAYPVVSETEERDLALRLRDQDDLEAAHRLVLSHLRFVISIARSYMGYGLPINDIAQEGTVGLMKAVRRFDPDMGVRLAGFAVHWIRAEIYEYVLRNWRIVKIATTKAQRKLFFKLRQAKRSLNWLSRQEGQQLAEDLDVPYREVQEMEQRLSASDLTYEADDDSRDSEAPQSPAPALFLGDNRNDPARLLEHHRDGEHAHRLLYQALETLDQRQRAIIEARWLSPEKPTLAQLAERYGVSLERVRQIEKAAIGKLGQAMADTAA